MADGTNIPTPEDGMGGTPPQRVPGGDDGEGYICAHASTPPAVDLGLAAEFVRAIREPVPDECNSEFRCLRGRKHPLGLKKVPKFFNSTGLENSVHDVLRHNSQSEQLGVYLVVNPTRRKSGASSAEDIISASWVFADFDDERSAENYHAFIAGTPQMAPTFRVITGKKPFERFHAYWRLTETFTDLNSWTSLQKKIAKRLGSDGAVVAPAQLMRVPGFISWPKPGKPGRVPELVTMEWGALCDNSR